MIKIPPPSNNRRRQKATPRIRGPSPEIPLNIWRETHMARFNSNKIIWSVLSRGGFLCSVLLDFRRFRYFSIFRMCCSPRNQLGFRRFKCASGATFCALRGIFDEYNTPHQRATRGPGGEGTETHRAAAGDPRPTPKSNPNAGECLQDEVDESIPERPRYQCHHYGFRRGDMVWGGIRAA